MTLRTRILIGYGIAMALLSAVLATGVLSLDPLGDATNAILRENYRSISAANEMLDILRQLDGKRSRVGSNSGTGVAELDAAFLASLTRAGDNVTIAGERDLISDIRTLYHEYRRGLSADSAAGGVPSVGVADTEQLRGRLLALRRMNRNRMYAASAEASRLARRALWMTLLPGAAALLLLLGFSLVLSNRLVHPIHAMVEAARSIGAGRLDVRLAEDRRDELGLLAAEFNRMAVEVQRFRDLNIDEVIVARNEGEAVLSNIDDGIILVDMELRVTSVNPAALRLLGRSSAAVQGAPALQALLPVGELHDTVRSAFADGITLPRPDEDRIFEVPGTQTMTFCQYSVELIRKSDGHPRGAVIVLRDVTRLKEVERLKSEFVMSASHELRTPLTSIGMSIELLAENLEHIASDRDRALLATAREEVARLRVLVEDLLDLSKIESGRIDVSFESVDLAALLRRIVTIFTPQCADKRVTLEWDAERQLPAVRADASKIALVLTNLVSNALRYVPADGAIRLGVDVYNRLMHVRVSDNGPGIPLEFQSRIFDRFMQVPGGSEGSGLGLAISKEIIKAHGGAIWVESSPATGSTFTFTLPLSAKE